MNSDPLLFGGAGFFPEPTDKARSELLWSIDIHILIDMSQR